MEWLNLYWYVPFILWGVVGLATARKFGWFILRYREDYLTLPLRLVIFYLVGGLALLGYYTLTWLDKLPIKDSKQDDN